MQNSLLPQETINFGGADPAANVHCGIPLEEANNVVAMAATHLDAVSMAATKSAKLFAVLPGTINFGGRSPAANVHWDPIGEANNVVAMAATNGKLFAVTYDNVLWARESCCKCALGIPLERQIM